jgi:hypothetical protein
MNNYIFTGTNGKTRGLGQMCCGFNAWLVFVTGGWLF